MKQLYSTPQLTVYGDVNAITRDDVGHSDPNGNAFGHSCGNAHVGGPSDCGGGNNNNPNDNNDNTHGVPNH